MLDTKTLYLRTMPFNYIKCIICWAFVKVESGTDSILQKQNIYLDGVSCSYF